MPESVLIVLPLPSKWLQPNNPPSSFGGRINKAKQAKAYRAKAKRATEEECVETAPWDYATIKVTFFHKESRRRDDLNFLGALKSAYDGIVDGGLLVDDDSEHLETAKPSFVIDKAFPRVELLIERVE